MSSFCLTNWRIFWQSCRKHAKWKTFTFVCAWGKSNTEKLSRTLPLWTTRELSIVIISLVMHSKVSLSLSACLAMEHHKLLMSFAYGNCCLDVLILFGLFRILECLRLKRKYVKLFFRSAGCLCRHFLFHTQKLFHLTLMYSSFGAAPSFEPTKRPFKYTRLCGKCDRNYIGRRLILRQIPTVSFSHQHKRTGLQLLSSDRFAENKQ